jgi:hypothetical protein
MATINKGVFEELYVLNRGYSTMLDAPSYLPNKLITNCGSGSFLFSTDLKKFHRKKNIVAVEVFVNLRFQSYY